MLTNIFNVKLGFMDFCTLTDNAEAQKTLLTLSNFRRWNFKIKANRLFLLFTYSEIFYYLSACCRAGASDLDFTPFICSLEHLQAT